MNHGAGQIAQRDFKRISSGRLAFDLTWTSSTRRSNDGSKLLVNPAGCAIHDLVQQSNREKTPSWEI